MAPERDRPEREGADPDVVTAALRSLRRSALRCRRAHIVIEHCDVDVLHHDDLAALPTPA